MPNMSFQPPRNWLELWKRIAAYRKTLLAPVDTIGCHQLRDFKAPKSVQRYQTLVALMLSSQTRDEVTAEAMQKLLKNGLTPENIVVLPEKKLNALISKVGFHNNKTKYLKATSAILIEKYNGTPPVKLEDIVELPGVGPKMAYLFLQEADNNVRGIGVDTHVHRLCHRFQWTPLSAKGPEDTRKVLESWLPRKYWGVINKQLVGLGQTICSPIRPRCSECQLSDICPTAIKEVSSRSSLPKNKKRSRVVDIEEILPHDKVKKRKIV